MKTEEAAQRQRLSGSAAIFLLPLIWFGGDLFYSRVVAHRAARWEASVRRDADGIRAGCQAFETGTGDRGLLLIHGFGDSPAVFRDLAPALAARGFTCRAMRLPGAAESVSKTADVRHADWIRAIEGELADLRARRATVWIAGHSLGGTLASECLAADPKAADGLVLMAPLIRVSGARSPVLPAKGWFMIADNLLFFTRTVEDFLPIDAEGDEAKAYSMDDHFFSSVAYREMFRAVGRVWECAPRLTRPLLMILAADDQVTDVRASRQFYEACAASPKELLVIEGSGHVIPIDSGWTQAVDAMARFIDAESASARLHPKE
jgi:esterase/lipase